MNLITVSENSSINPIGVAMIVIGVVLCVCGLAFIIKEHCFER